MLLNGGEFGGHRILERKTIVEQACAVCPAGIIRTAHLLPDFTPQKK
jgi:hypothetical protein